MSINFPSYTLRIIKDELEKDETLLLAVPSNYLEGDTKTVGVLVLTDKRIRFKSHHDHVQNRKFSILLTDINRIAPSHVEHWNRHNEVVVIEHADHRKIVFAIENPATFVSQVPKKP